jgi:hypothetical protein
MPLNTFGEWEDAGDTPNDLEDMSIEQLRALSYREAAEAHAAMREQAQSPVENPTESMSLEQIRELALKEEREALQAEEDEMTATASKQFVELHPEYFPVGSNLQAFIEYGEKNKVPFTSVAQLEDAYQELTKAGKLTVDPAREAKVQEMKTYARFVADAQLRAQRSEEARRANNVETLPLNELATVADRQMRDEREAAQRQAYRDYKLGRKK